MSEGIWHIALLHSLTNKKYYGSIFLQTVLFLYPQKIVKVVSTHTKGMATARVVSFRFSTEASRTTAVQKQDLTGFGVPPPITIREIENMVYVNFFQEASYKDGLYSSLAYFSEIMLQKNTNKIWQNLKSLVTIFD